MRIFKSFLTVAAFLVTGLFAANSLAELKDYDVMTETYPPYNFKQSGQLKGIAVEMLLAASQKGELGLSRDDIRLLPWARGYQNVQEQPGSMLFSTTRTESREDLFRWAGPITETSVALIARKGADLSFENQSDYASPTIAVVRDDVAESLVRDKGAQDNNLDVTSRPEPAMRKLAAGRVDAWAYEANVAFWLLNSEDYDTDNYEVVDVLSESELFYAFHKDTPDKVVDSLQDALDALSEKERDKILDQYL
ncbi:transporter substrate-binding domain-containing protein [Salicola sp. Rm-C-2C1-2]|uniref:substrate-binding periplasmic protein n=1 Tax=Salicola sp. Rm-C-2C1-2 TaxID=3141321 RepID=UPI0032E4FB80